MFRPLTRPQIVVDATAAVVFCLFAGFLALPLVGSVAPMDGGLGAVAALMTSLVVSLVFSVVLGLRRFAPGLALGIAWAAAIVQMLCQLPPLPANLAILAVLYTCAAYGTRRLLWIAFASSILGAAAITAYLLVPNLANVFVSPADTLAGYVFAGGALFLSSALGLMLAWTVGALVRVGVSARTSAEARRRAEERAAAESERNRIARDMHDVVAHSLAVVIAQADGARYAVAAGAAEAGSAASGEPAASDPAAEALRTISTTARSALSDVRMLLTQLRHSQAEGPQPTVADLEGLYASVRRSGVDLRVDIDPAPPGEPPAAVQLAVYRILQEALTNAMRHGAPGPVEVSLAWLADRVELSVRNPVPGAAAVPAHPAALVSPAAGGITTVPAHLGAAAAHPGAPAAHPGGGHGLIGMRERAQLIGGRLQAGPAAGVFVVSATLPIGGVR